MACRYGDIEIPVSGWRAETGCNLISSAIMSFDWCSLLQRNTKVNLSGGHFFVQPLASQWELAYIEMCRVRRVLACSVWTKVCWRQSGRYFQHPLSWQANSSSCVPLLFCSWKGIACGMAVDETAVLCVPFPRTKQMHLTKEAGVMRAEFEFTWHSPSQFSKW